MLKEFRDFAVRGNVIDMAVGIIIGAAFTTIVTSLVQHVLMPPIGLALGGADFSNLFIVLRDGATPGPYASVAAAKTAGAVTVNIGVFLNTLRQFPHRSVRGVPAGPVRHSPAASRTGRARPRRPTKSCCFEQDRDTLQKPGV